MSQGVVDSLEAIQVYKQNRDGIWGFPDLLECFFKLFLEQKTVAKTSECFRTSPSP